MNSIHARISDSVAAGAGKPLLFIAGPCQIESLEHCLLIAQELKETCRQFPVQFVFKSSFDKANRSSVDGKRGPGLETGLKVLSEVRRQVGVPVLTDIHSPQQAFLAAAAVDVLQIPAFLCRQTDLLVAAGKTGKAINVKKGQFLHPADMHYVAEKIASTANKNIMLCERGACFGYRDLVVDMRSLIIMRETGYPVIFDATHSVQEMGGAGGASGGNRQYVVPLACAAAAVGIDGLFVECHENPPRAPSDGASMLYLDAVKALLEKVCRLRPCA